MREKGGKTLGKVENIKFGNFKMNFRCVGCVQMQSKNLKKL